MAMTIVEPGRTVVGGVDTHLDVHVAAALDPIGGVLGVESFDATPRGYEAMFEWMGAFGTVSKVGVEGTGAYCQPSRNSPISAFFRHVIP
jgi:transposase